MLLLLRQQQWWGFLFTELLISLASLAAYSESSFSKLSGFACYNWFVVSKKLLIVCALIPLWGFICCRSRSNTVAFWGKQHNFLVACRITVFWAGSVFFLCRGFCFLSVCLWDPKVSLTDSCGALVKWQQLTGLCELCMLYQLTADLRHVCTHSHTGTSASAPLAAGICALALQAKWVFALQYQDSSLIIYTDVALI